MPLAKKSYNTKNDTYNKGRLRSSIKQKEAKLSDLNTRLKEAKTDAQRYDLEVGIQMYKKQLANERRLYSKRYGVSKGNKTGNSGK